MTLKNFIDRMRKRILDRREQQKPRSSGRLRVTRLEDRKLLDASFGVSMGGALSLSGFDTGDTLTADGDLSAGDGVFKLTSGIWDSGSAGLGLTLSGDLKTLTVALGPAAVTELNIDGTSTAAGQLANLASTTGLTVNNLNIAEVDDVDLSTGTNDVVDNIAVTNVTSLNLTDANSVNIAALTASGDVTISSVAGNITDSGGATISVGGNADFDANSITLGDDPSDTTNFGTLTFSSVGSVDITEDSATELTADNDAGTLSLTTSGALTSASGTSLDVVNDANLEADSIDLPNSAGGRMVNFGSVQFSAQGDVNLHENTGIHISADSESVSGDVTLNADGDLTMAAGVTLSADDIHLTANETTTDFGHIGSIADAFTVDGTTLTTFSNGDQVLASVGEISSFDLDSIDNVDTPAGLDPDGTNGAITLQSGTFVLDDPNNIVGDLSIATGAAITGTGIVTDITFDAGSVFEVDINGLILDTEYDQLNASGDVVIAGTLHISDTIIPAHLSTFTIVNNSAGTTTGMFTGLAEGATIAGDNGQRFSISYAGGDGNDVVLTALTPTYDLSSTPAEYTYNENTGSGSATITVVRSGDLSIQSSVSVNVTADSATADDDFAQGVHTVTFEVGDVSKTFDVAIVNDQIVEADETIQIALVAPTSAALLGTNDSATLTIVDEDTATVTLSGATVTVIEGNSGTASLTFDVTLDNAVDGGFDIAYATNNGSAVAGSDYVDNDGTLSFTGGIGESHRITVVVNGDAVVETTEALNVSLAAAATASVDNAAITVAGTPLTGTITNDDSATLSIADNLTINEGDGTATFTINSSAASQEDITVSVLLTDGTTSSSDVALSSATATILGDGTSTSAAVTVSLTDDQRLEGSETFSISISSPLFDGAATAATAALVTLSDAMADGAIADNDTATLGFTAASSNVDEDSTTHDVRSSLSLSTTGTGTAGLDRAVSFDVEVLTATATDIGTNADYTFATKSVTFAAGSNGAVFNDDAAITIHEDLLDDDAETIELTLTAVTDGSGGQLSTGTTLHTVTINDDDTATVGSLDLQAGAGDVIVQVNGLDLEIYVGSNLVATRPTTGLGSIHSLVINGSTSDESVTIDASSGTLNTTIQFNGGDGADTLQIINPAASTYNPTGGITFHGNAGDDTLELVDGTAASVEHQFTNNSDGSVLYNGAAAVTYTGLAPIVDTITATTRVFSFTGAAEDITLSDDGTAGDNMSLIDSTLGESVTFLTATDSVTINTEASGGSGIDTISVQGVDSAWTADLVINAGNDDTVTFETNTTTISSGDLSVTANNINVNAALTIAGGDLTIDANSALATNSAISSSGGVTSITAGTTAVLNGTVDGTNDLTLNVTGSTTFAAAVGAITAIGDGTDAALIINSTGATEFQSTVSTSNGILQNNAAGTVTFADDVTVAGGGLATVFNGNVILDGLTFASVADVTFGNAATDSVGTSSAPVVISTTNDGRVTFNAATSLGSDLTINTGAGDVTFNATVDGSSNLSVNSTSATAFNAVVGSVTALTSITTNVGGTLAIGADVSAGIIDFNESADVTLTANSAFTATIIDIESGIAGALTLTLDGSTGVDINGTISTTNLTTETAATINAVDISGNLIASGGDLTTDVGGIEVAGNATTTAVDLISNTLVDIDGNTSLGGNATAVGGAILLGTTAANDVTLTADALLTATAMVSVAGSITGSFDVDFAGATGNAVAETIGASVANVDVSAGNLTAGTIDITGNLTSDAGLNIETTIGAINVDGALSTGGTLIAETDVNIGGISNLGGNVTASGLQDYNGAATLTADVVLASTGNAAISLDSTLDGAFNLAVNTTAATTFGGVVGGATALTSLTTNAGGTTAINGAGVTTSGNQTYNDAVTLGTDTVLTGAIINNTATVTGVANALTIVGNADIDAGISGVTNFSVGGTANIGADVTSTGTQLYSSAVTLSDDVTTAGVGLIFAAAVDGDFQLTADGGTGNITFADAVGAIARLSGLVVDAVNVDFDNTVAVDDQGLDVDASGTLSFDDAVSTTTGGAVTLSNGGAMTLAAAADFAIDGAFSQDGLGVVTTAADIITTADTISFAAAVTQTGSVLLDTTNSASTPAGANITLNTVAGGTNSLSLNAGSGGAIASGQVSDVDTLTIVDSATTVFSDTVSATTVAIDDSTTVVTFDGALTATNLTVAAGAYGVHLNAGGTITNAVTFNNTNGVTFGNDTGDILNFAGGVISTASTTNIQGTLNTTGQNVTLGETTLAAATSISTGAAGGTITAGQVSGSGVALTLNAGTGNVLLANAANVIGDLIVDAADVTITEADGITQSAAWTTTGVTTLNAAANSINLTNAANQFGTLNLAAANATISETTDLTIGAAVVTSTISLTSNGSINDAASDTATDITATTIDLNAASGIGDAAELEVSATAISADTTVGNINIDNAAATATDVTSLTSGNGDIDFDQSAAGNVEFSGPVSSGGGAITLAAVNELTVSSSVSSAPGTGGTLAIGGATIGGTVSVGAGDVSIQGGGVDLNINAQLTSDSHITLTAERDVIVSAVVDANSGSNIVITSDSNSDTDAGSAPTAGHGGVQISAAGQLNAAGDITVTGSDVFATAGDVDSVLIAADTTNVQMLAGGQISISNGGNAPSGAAVVIDGVVQSTGGGSTIDIAAAGNVEFGSFGDVSTNDGAISITADTEAGSNGGQVVMADGTQVSAGSGTIGVTADGNVSLGQLNSTATVSVTSESGSIVDGGDSDVDIIAAATAFNAATGIGTDANALDTATAGGGSHTITAQTDSGDIHVANAGSLTVGTVGTVSGITITDDSGSGSDAPDSTLDNITLSAASPLTIAAAITNNDGGGISLTSANDGGSDDHLTINAALTITGGDATEDATGNIDLNAGTDLVINASASTDAAGFVSAIAAVDILLAAGNITTVDGDVQLTATAGQISMTDGTVVQSTSGDLTATAETSVAISSIITNSNVNITATTAAITDSGDSGIDIGGATATLVAATGIGSTNAIDTTIAVLNAANSVSGTINVADTDALAIDVVNNATRNVTLSAGGAMTDANAAAVNVTAGLLTVTAAGEIDLDTTINSLTASTSAAGGINIAENNAVELTDVNTADGSITVSAGGSVTAVNVDSAATDNDNNDISLTTTSGDILVDLINAGATNDVTLSAAGAISETATDAGADLLAGDASVTAASGIGSGDALETSLTNLAFDNAISGDVQITNSQTLNIASAGGPTASANAGGNIELCVTAGNLNVDSALTAAGNTIRLGAAGDITQSAAGVITSDSLGARATGDILLASATAGNNVDSVFAAEATAGTIAFADNGGFTVGTVAAAAVNVGDCFSQAVGVTATAGDVQLTSDSGHLTNADGITAGGAGNVTLTTTTLGDVVLTGTTTADANTVTINSVQSINGAGLVTAATVDLNAESGIGDTTALELVAAAISADTTNGNIDINNALATPTTVSSLVTGTGTITFDQSGTGRVNFGTATTTDGTIDLQNTGGDLTIDTAVTAGGGGNVLLTTAAAGDVVLTGIVTAAGNTVTIDSADQIIGDATNTAADIVSDDAILNAVNGIGDGTGNALETTIDSLTVSNTNSGDVNLSNSQALNVGSLSNTVGSIELCIAVGNLTLTGLMDAGTNTVRLQTDTGSVIESGAGRITAGQLGVRAQNDVTLASNSNNVDTFAAAATTGSVVFNEADGFAVDVVSAGDCFAEVTGVTTPGSGDITLHALTGDLQISSDVTANTGNINLTANSVTQNANIATTAAGTIDIVADNGSITMADGTATSTATGTIVLAATNNVGISQLNSTDGNITVTADSQFSGAGAMTDVTAVETANISTTGLTTLSAATGIGAAGVADIDTTITTLQATNTTSGDIVIEETDALIVAGTGISNAGGNIDVDVTAGDLQLTAAAATTGDNVGLTAVAGSVSSTAAGTIVTTGNTTNEDSGTVIIDAANNVSLVGQVDTSGLNNAVDAQDSNAGDITLTATAGDVTVTNLQGSGGSTSDPTILGDASNITLNAGNDVHVISAIADNGTSVVDIDAGNNVTIDLLTANGLAATNTGGGDIDITAAIDVLIDSITATGTAAQVNITATAGDIVDNNDNATIPSTVNITTPDGMTRLSAGGSIGVVPTAGGVFKPTASGNAFEIRSDNVQILAAQNANVAELGSGTVQILSADTAFISSVGDLDFSTAAVTTNNLALNVDGTLTLPPAAGPLVVADDLSIIAGNVEAAGGIDITADRLLFKSGESEEITIQGNAGGPIAFDGQTTTAADGDLTINVDTAMALTDLDCDEFALDVNDNIAVINAAGVVIDQADQSTQAMFDSKIRSGSLVLNGSGTYDLTNPLNDTDILAGNNTGDIAFKDIDDVTVDTVNVVTNTASTITGLSTNNGNVQLDAGTTLTINQQLNAGTGDMRLISHGDITQAAAGIITANALGIQQLAATGDIRLAAQNDINVLAAESAAAAGSLTFADLDDVIVGAVSASTVSNSTFAIATGITTNNGNITIDAGPAAATPDSLAITEQVSAGTADVRLIADGNITQTADGTITADKLGVRQQQATGNIVLDDANAVNELAALNTASGGQVAFRNTQPLVLQTVTALDVAAAPTANAVSFAETNGVVTNNGDVLIDVDGSLTVNQQLNVGTAAARILAAGNVTQSAAGTIIANELGIRQQAATGDITLGAAANDVNTIAAENAAVSGQIAFFDADELTVSEVANLSIGNLTFATTTGINTNAGNINITSEGDLVVTEEINAAHETIIASIDESITLTSRSGNFTLADNTVITSDEDPAAGVFDDITADAITIIAGSSGTNGTVDLGDNIEIRTDGGVAKQVAPRPTAFATAGTVNDAAFVTLADAENSRANLTFVSAGFLGILDLVIGVAGEENLEIVVDWGAISQTNLTEFGPAGDATSSTGVPGALEFGLEDGDKSTFYIDEGGQEYLIPHIYAVGDLTTTDNDRNGRETNPSIFGVRFSVAQHASINIWGSDAIDPTTGTPDTAPADFTGTSPTLTDATGAAINPAATALALLSSTDTNNLRDFSQEAAQLPLLNDDVTTTGRPVGLAEWEFVAGPSPGLVLIQATPRPTVEVAKIDAPFYTPVVSEIADTLDLSAGASSDAAIGTEVYLQIRRYFELDAEAEVVIARITDSDFIANRESFESFVEENPELQDGAGYEVWLITETSGQRVERPIVKFEITGGRPGPATEVLPDTFEPYELKELEFEQPAEDADVPAESHSESNATSAVDPTDDTQPANDNKVSVKFTGEQDSASDIAAAVLLPAVTLTRAARWKRQQQKSTTQDKGFSRTARTLRRMRETT